MALSRRQFNRAATIGTGGTVLQNMAIPWFMVKHEDKGTGSALSGLRMQAVHSQVVVDSFGVNIQPGEKNYTFAATEQWVVDLGVRNVRRRMYGDNIGNGRNEFIAGLCRDHGVRWHATAGPYDPDDTEASRRDVESHLEAEVLAAADILEGLGGYNEPNGIRLGPLDPNWETYCRNHNQWMFGMKSANPTELAGCIIYGPSLHDHPPGGDVQLQADYNAISIVAPYMERIEMHRYPGGAIPSNGIDQRTGWAVNGVGASKLPVGVSETGYNHAPGWVNYVPNAVIGSYYPRLLAEHVERGNKIWIFELFDQYDPTAGDHENFFGMLSAPTPNVADLTPLKQYTAMKNMLALFEDGTAAYTANPLQVTIGGNPSIQTFLTQKRNGHWVMMLWRDLKLWDKATQSQLSPAAVNGTLTFPASRTVKKYIPAVGTTFTQTVGTNHTISVGGDLVVLDIL